MHGYEHHILKKMALGEELRYRDLKLKEHESNLFIYHLKKLINRDYIQKSEKGYKLTTRGYRYIDKLSFSIFRPRLQSKIVTVIILKNSKGEHLIYIRKRQPFINLLAFPYGKVHFGEKIMNAVERELKEKTGLSAKLIHRGNVYITINKNKEPITSMLCHVFLGSRPIGKLIMESEAGSCVWMNVKNIDKEKFIPGFLEIFVLISKSKNQFFTELTFDR